MARTSVASIVRDTPSKRPRRTPAPEAVTPSPAAPPEPPVRLDPAKTRELRRVIRDWVPPPADRDGTLTPEALAACDETLCAVMGVKTIEVAFPLLGWLIKLTSTPATQQQGLLPALALLGELQPASALEALLAVQMIGVHQKSTEFLIRSTIEGQTVDGADRNVLRAVRLMRLFTEQLEAMAKLKGKTGQQRVVVEHVTVHEGGQAIVGAVTTRPRGEGVGGG